MQQDKSSKIRCQETEISSTSYLSYFSSLLSEERAFCTFSTPRLDFLLLLPQSLLNRLGFALSASSKGEARKRLFLFPLSFHLFVDFPLFACGAFENRPSIRTHQGDATFGKVKRRKVSFSPYLLYILQKTISPPSLSPSEDPSQLYCPPVSTLPPLFSQRVTQKKEELRKKVPFLSFSLFPLPFSPRLP